VTVTAVVTVGSLTATGEFNASSNDSSGISVQVNVDVDKTISALSSLGFSGRQIPTSGTSGSSYRPDCAESATGLVRKFLYGHHCEQYHAEMWTITRQDVTFQVAFSWVEMSTASLASQYKV
jgi:hypothetical protein